MKIKNIFLGILVLALSALMIGSAIAVVTWDPVITVASWDEDTKQTLDLTTVSNGIDPVTYTVNDGLSNLEYITVIIDGSGIATFTPDANWHGLETVVFDGTDINGTVQSPIITLTVDPINDAPTFNWDFASMTIRENEEFNYDTLLDDVDVDVLTVDVTGLPNSLTVNPTTGELSGTPVDGDEGVYTATMTVSDGPETVTKTETFYLKDKYDDGKLEIDDVNFEDLTGDDDKHYPGDIIEIEVEIINNDIDYVMEDVTVYIESKSLDIEEIDIDEIDEDDSVTEIIEIQIPYDADDAYHDFEITVKGRDDSEDRDYHFSRYFETEFEDIDIDVQRSQHDIIVSDLKISPDDDVEAGDTIIVTAEIANIGRKDEDNAEVTIKNTDLGINVVSDDYDLKSGKTKTFIFNIEVPRTAEAKTYNLEAIASYDDDSSDEEDTPLSKTVDLKVNGGTIITLSESLTDVFGDVLNGGTATLTATKTSLSAERGKAVKYDLLLRNTDINTKLYELKITGVSDWATYLIEAGGETNKVSIPAGMSLPVYVYMTPKTTATSGTHTASVAVYSGSQLAGSEILTANIAGGFGEGLTTGLFTGAGTMFSPVYDWLTWVVVGLVALVAGGVVIITLYLKQKD